MNKMSSFLCALLGGLVASVIGSIATLFTDDATDKKIAAEFERRGIPIVEFHDDSVEFSSTGYEKRENI
jgi:uncharacterized protein YkuJ